MSSMRDTELERFPVMITAVITISLAVPGAGAETVGIWKDVEGALADTPMSVNTCL